MLVLAVQSARVVWIVAEPSGPFGSPPVASAAGSERKLAILDTFNPFAPRTPAVSNVTSIDGVTLHGVRVTSGGGSSAIIASAGKQSVHWVGEEIAPGAVLKEVASDHVVIAQGSRIAKLTLAARSAQPASTASVPSYMLPARPTVSNRPPAVAAVDTKKLLEEAGLRPRTQDGQITGYTLLPRGGGEMLGRAGLAAGDVLVALNGNRLTPERYSEIEQELTGASQVQVTVERGNETRTITLQTGK